MESIMVDGMVCSSGFRLVVMRAVDWASQMAVGMGLTKVDE
jgi:hypothetical protein